MYRLPPSEPSRVPSDASTNTPAFRSQGGCIGLDGGGLLTVPGGNQLARHVASFCPRRPALFRVCCVVVRRVATPRAGLAGKMGGNNYNPSIPYRPGPPRTHDPSPACAKRRQRLPEGNGVSSSRSPLWRGRGRHNTNRSAGRRESQSGQARGIAAIAIAAQIRSRGRPVRTKSPKR